MKRILYIAPNLTVKGGISTVLKMYLETDLPLRYDLGFVATHEDGTKLHKLWVMLAGIVHLLNALIVKRIDIVHIHCGDIPSPYRKYIFFKISRWFKCNVVLHLHGALFLEQYKKASEFWKERLKTLFIGADAVICLSQSWSEAIGSLYPKSRRIVIPNGILLPVIAKTSARDLRSMTQIVFLGLIGPRKGLFDLLTVFDRLVKEGYDIGLSIGGNGEIARLRSCIAANELENRANYLGWIKGRQKERLLRSSDIFVLPSYGEGMPISILEAMAYGLPVVSTLVGGIPELVEEGVTGFLVEPGDLDSLYDRLKTLIEQQNLRVQMGLNARRKVENAFDLRNNYKAISQVYDQLLSN
jgi:glycosyltransferase involved in cell wall biosynthesis